MCAQWRVGSQAKYTYSPLDSAEEDLKNQSHFSVQELAKMREA